MTKILTFERPDTRIDAKPEGGTLTTIRRPLNLEILHEQIEAHLRAERLKARGIDPREFPIPFRLRQDPFLQGAAAGEWTFTNAAITNLLNGTHDLDTDTWKVALFLSTSNIGAGSTTYAGLTNEVANGVGYTTGGVAVTLTLSGTTTVTVAVSSNPSWTASGGDIENARFAVLYEVSGAVLCYCLLDATPADVDIQDGNSLAIDMDGTPAIFTVAQA